MKFQIEFHWVGSSYSWSYFDCERLQDAPYLASHLATQKYKDTRYLTMPKTLHVKEYDSETQKPKRGGHRFKIRRTFIQVNYGKGHVQRDEWYEPADADVFGAS